MQAIAEQVTERPRPRLEAAPKPDQARDIADVFNELTAKWKAETELLSDMTKKSTNWSYQQIIGLGPAVLPLILKELEREPDDWFWALRAITRQNAIKKEHVGKVKLMAKDWIEWGKERGLA